MGQIIAFSSLTRDEPRSGHASTAADTTGELVALGRNDIATVIETILLLREAGRGDLLDAFNRGPAVQRRARRRHALGA